MKFNTLMILTLMSLSIETSFGYAPKLCTQINHLVIKDSAEPLQIYEMSSASGIIVDFLTEALPGNCSFNSQVYPFKRMIKLMTDKSIKHWINYGAKEWGTIQVNRASKTPLLFANNNLITNAPNKLNSLKQLFGKTVILITGFNYPGLEKYLKSGKIKPFYVKNYNSAVKALVKKRGVGFVGMDFRIKYTIKRLFLNKDHFILNNFSHVIPGSNIHLTYSKDFPSETKMFLDQKILEYKESGKLKKIIARYTE